MASLATGLGESAGLPLGGTEATRPYGWDRRAVARRREKRCRSDSRRPLGKGADRGRPSVELCLPQGDLRAAWPARVSGRWTLARLGWLKEGRLQGGESRNLPATRCGRSDRLAGGGVGDPPLPRGPVLESTLPMVRRETRSLRAVSAREQPSASSPTTATGSTAFGGRPSGPECVHRAVQPHVPRGGAGRVPVRVGGGGPGPLGRVAPDLQRVAAARGPWQRAARTLSAEGCPKPGVYDPRVYLTGELTGLVVRNGHPSCSSVSIRRHDAEHPGARLTARPDRQTRLTSDVVRILRRTLRRTQTC
jgi:hypothetical protein